MISNLIEFCRRSLFSQQLTINSYHPRSGSSLYFINKKSYCTVDETEEDDSEEYSSEYYNSSDYTDSSDEYGDFSDAENLFANDGARSSEESTDSDIPGVDSERIDINDSLPATFQEFRGELLRKQPHLYYKREFQESSFNRRKAKQLTGPYRSNSPFHENVFEGEDDIYSEFQEYIDNVDSILKLLEPKAMKIRAKYMKENKVKPPKLSEPAVDAFFIAMRDRIDSANIDEYKLIKEDLSNFGHFDNSERYWDTWLYYIDKFPTSTLRISDLNLDSLIRNTYRETILYKKIAARVDNIIDLLQRTRGKAGPPKLKKPQTPDKSKLSILLYNSFKIN